MLKVKATPYKKKKIIIEGAILFFPCVWCHRFISSLLIYKYLQGGCWKVIGPSKKSPPPDSYIRFWEVGQVKNISSPLCTTLGSNFKNQIQGDKIVLFQSSKWEVFALKSIQNPCDGDDRTYVTTSDAFFFFFFSQFHLIRNMLTSIFICISFSLIIIKKMTFYNICTWNTFYVY